MGFGKVVSLGGVSIIGVGFYKLKLNFFIKNKVNIKNKPTTPSWVVRLSSHMGAEKYPTVGSSGEYWSINESLNQHYA